MRKNFTTAQLTAVLARPALLALEGVARQLGVKVPPEAAARSEERPVPSPEALATSEGVSSDEAVNGAPRGVGSRASAAPVVTREESRPAVVSARGLAPTSPREGLNLPFAEAPHSGGASASPGASGLHLGGVSAPHAGQRTESGSAMHSDPGATGQRTDSGSAMHSDPGATGQRTESGSAMHASPGALGPRTVRVIRPSAPANAKPLTSAAPGADVPALPLSEGSTAASAHGATPAAPPERRVVRLLPSKPSSTPAMPERGDATHNATSVVPPRTDAHPGAPAVAAPRRRLTFLPEEVGSTTEVGSPTHGMTGTVAPPEATASPAPALAASESSTERGAPSSGLTQPASRVSTSAIGAPATNVPLAVRAAPRPLDLTQPEPEASAPAAVRPHPDPRAGVPSFAPADGVPDVERATPRQQAAPGRLTEQVSAGLTPVWEQAQRVSQAAPPVERVTTSSSQGAAVRNTFNVNVHLDSSEAPAGMDRRSLEDALVDILRETARRHGLEV